MRVVLVGALNGAFALAAGAFGAHLLDGRVAVADEALFQSAVIYQLVLAAAMVGMGGLKEYVIHGFWATASVAMAVGTVLFSIGLYSSALGGPEFIGFAAPIGGALVIIGWLLLAVSAARPS
ncbi:MAG: DUF423 domain-containing protein [Pseudomonadota bacterium]